MSKSNELAIGERRVIDGILVECLQDQSDEDGCVGCHFRFGHCSYADLECRSSYRRDGFPVHFIAVKEGEAK